MDRIIRPTEYLRLLERLIDKERVLGEGSMHKKGMLIWGNPAIGKSLFMDVLTWLLLSCQSARPFHVMVYDCGRLVVFTRDTSGTPVRVTHRSVELAHRHPQKFVELLEEGVMLKRKDRVILLHDVEADNGQPYNSLLLQALQKNFDTYTICACSPDRRSETRGVENDFAAEQHSFPDLSEAESICFAMHAGECANEEEALRRYGIVGGSPGT
jgi:hypothetical protein